MKRWPRSKVWRLAFSAAVGWIVFTGMTAESFEQSATDAKVRDCVPLRDACLAGDGTACEELTAAHLGTGASCADEPPQPERARWFARLACESGSLRGCVTLATMLRDLGELTAHGIPGGVPRQETCAALELGCEGGDLEACHRLGVALDNISDANCVDRPFDLVASARYLERSCNNGYVEDCTRAAFHLKELEEHESARRLFIEAERQLRSSCFDGFGPSACLQLARGIAQGWFAGDAADVDLYRSRGTKLAERSCELGDEADCHLAAELARPTGDDPSPARELFFRLRACELGQAFSCVDAAETLRRGADGVGPDHDRAIELFERACELYPYACGDAGALLEAREAPEFLGRALWLYTKACVLRKDCSLCGTASQMLEEGRGAPKSEADATALRSVPFCESVEGELRRVR